MFDNPFDFLANAIAVNSQGEAYIVAGYQVWKLDSSGKAVGDKPFQVQTANFSAAAISPSGDLLLTGTIFSGSGFPTTPNAFQSNASRFYVPVIGDFTSGDSSDAGSINLMSIEPALLMNCTMTCWRVFSTGSVRAR